MPLGSFVDGESTMEVRIGNSIELADTSWRRQDITLDETDLQRLLIDAGHNPDIFVPTDKAFRILELEAQRLLLYQMIVRYEIAMKTSENIALVQRYKKQRDDLLDSLKTENDA